MESFAVAYVPSASSASSTKCLSVKVNLNLWTQCGWNDSCPVLDIGLQLENLSTTKKLRLYIPFKVQKEHLSDLGEYLVQEGTLLGAVFNEPYTSARIPDSPKKANVFHSTNMKKPLFTLYCLDFSDGDVEIQDFKKGGSFLDFDIERIISNASGQCDTYYLRFRIQSEKLHECVREYKAPNRFFETLVTSTYIVDMRFNNTRSMSSSLVESLTSVEQYRLAPISSLHFLLMAKVDVDVDTEQCPNVSSRTLEEKVWDKYVQGSDKTVRSTKDIIAYHFKKKYEKSDKSTNSTETPDIGSWEFFTRLKTGRCSTKTLIPYLIVFLCLDMMGNSTYELLNDLATGFGLKDICVKRLIFVISLLVCGAMIWLQKKKKGIKKRSKK